MMASFLKSVLDSLRLSKRTSDRARERNRRYLRLETLEDRSLMALDLAVISGTSFVDLTGNGLTGDDTRVGGATVQLFRDTNANGTFESGTDALLTTATTNATTGAYSFASTNAGGTLAANTITAGNYFVRQLPIASFNPPSTPALVTISAGDRNGTPVRVIDPFSAGAQSVTANGAGPVANNSAADASIVGGERDIQVNYASGAGDLQIDVFPGLNIFSFDSGFQVVGTALLQYDGVDGTGTLAPTGLGAISLNAGNPLAGLQLSAQFEKAGASAVVRIYSNATDFSTSTINLPSPALEQIFVPFSSFVTGGGAGANFNSVGAIEVLVNGVIELQASISVVQSLRPTVVTSNLQNTSGMTIGNLVFLDRNNDGLFAGADTGIGGVTVQLFNDLGVVGTFEPGTDTAVTVGTSTTTTSTTVGSVGQYSFTGLLPGNYMVVIPASQFGAGQPLLNHISSPGATVGDIDNADHGAAFVAGVGVTGAVVLTAGGEPTTEDGDNNTNLTMDFGFVSAVLGLTKTDTPDPVRTGQNLTYTLTATNNGPSNSTNTVITDALPTGLTFVPVGSNYSVNGGPLLDLVNTAGTITTAPFTLASGQSAVMRIIATVGATFVTATQNTGSVDNDEGLPVTANATTGLVPNIDLAIDKSIVGGALTVGIGDTLTYQLNLTNTSVATTVTGIRVTDNLPTGFTPGALPAGVVVGVAANEDLVWTIPTLAPGASISVSIPVTVTVAAALGSVGNDNVATIDVAGLVGFRDSNDSNDRDTVSVTVQPRYNLLVTKNNNVAAVTTGQNVTYTIEINNSGLSAATNVQVTDILPAGLQFVSARIGAVDIGTISGQTYSATIPTLAAGATTTILLVAQVRPGATGTTIDNRVDISAESPANETPGRPNFAIDSDTLNRPVTLNVTKDDSVDTVIAGGANFTYTVTAFNSGSADAPNVLFSDPLPTGLRFDNGSFTINEAVPRTGQVTFNNATNRLEANLGTLLAGGSSTVNRALITLTVQAFDTAAAGTITNTARLTSPDNVPGVTDSENTTINRTFDLTVTNTVNAERVSRGDTLTYRIVLSNSGVSAASNVTLSSPLPANTTISSVNSSSGSFSNVNGTITGTLPTLRQGSPVTVTVSVTVNNDAPEGSVINNVAVVSAAGETDVLTNTANAVATIASTASLRGFVYVDVDRNNLRGAGDRGISDVLITISGTINAQTVKRTTTTDANGEYFFTGLVPGNYTVVQTQPANYVSAATNRGSLGGTESTNQIAAVVLAPGVSSIDNNFGEIREFSKRQFLASTIDN